MVTRRSFASEGVAHGSAPRPLPPAAWRCLLFLRGQRVGAHAVAGLGARGAVPAGHDEHVLPAVFSRIAHRRGLPTRRQAVLPEGAAIVQVVGAHVVVQRARVERHAAAGEHRPADARHAHAEGQRQRREIAHRAVAVLPCHFAGAQVHAGHIAPGRCLAGQAHGRHERLHRGGEGRAEVLVQRRQAALGRAAVLHEQAGVVLARHQSGNEREVGRRGEGHLPLRIDGDAAPVEDAEIARIDDAALLRRRREAALVAQAVEGDAAGELVEHRSAPHVALGERRRVERQGRLRLRGRRAVSLRGALWRGMLRHRQDRRAGAPVEHEQLALLGGLHQRWHGLAAHLQVDQRGLRGHVVVPQVMVHGLEVPAHLAAVQVQRDDGGRVLLHRRAAVAAPLVGRLIAHGHVHHAERFVHAGDGPAVGRVGRVRAAGRQGRRVIGVAGVPVPDQRSGVDVERADHARLLLHRGVVQHRAAHDHEALRDHHGRRRIVGARAQVGHALPQVDLPRAAAEVGAYGSAFGVERDHASIGRGHEELGAAGGIGGAFAGRDGRLALVRRLRGGCRRLRGGGRGVRRGLGALAARSGARHGIERRGRCVGDGIARRLVRQPPAGQVLQRELALDLGVVAPELLARGGVERDHRLVRRAQEKAVADLQRRDLVRGLFRVSVLAAHVTRAELPGHLQLRGVVGRDLRQRGEALAIAGAAVGMPFAVGQRGRGLGRGGHGFPRQPAGQLMRSGKPGRSRQHGGQQQRQPQRHARHAQRGSPGRGIAGRTRLERCGLTQQGPAHPRRREPEAEHEKHIQPRGQRPPVHAHLPDCPGRGAQQERGVHPEGRRGSPREEHARSQQRQSGDEVIGAAAQ